MPKSILIRQASMVNAGTVQVADVLIENQYIAQIGEHLDVIADMVIPAQGLYLLPGVIDTHVHFREPGLGHKGDIGTESKAAVAGGVTSFIDMPNTVPNVLDNAALQAKYAIAANSAFANYAFYMGVCYKNIDYILQQPPGTYFCITDDGLYMHGESMLLTEHADDMQRLFAHYRGLIAIHSENEQIIDANLRRYVHKYGINIPAHAHANIRSAQACYTSTERAVKLAEATAARLHILHLTTQAELQLLQPGKPVTEKNISAEVCMPHLCFTAADYKSKGALIKCNPSVKYENARHNLWKALNDDRIDIISTDHAPHGLSEKQMPYLSCPSGMPMVQHALPLMLDFYLQGKISIGKIVQKMCHNPALLYGIEKRGYISTGYFADMVLVNLNAPWQVTTGNILYKCGWSPLMGHTLNSRVTHTFVNGHLAYNNGRFSNFNPGQPLRFSTPVYSV
jgi:dihydroorotase